MSKKKVKQENRVYAIYPKGGGGEGFQIEERLADGDKPYKCIKGFVSTPHGYLRAWSMYLKGSVNHSTIEAIKDGKKHYRDFDRAYSQKGLVMKAKQFARELFER